MGRPGPASVEKTLGSVESALWFLYHAGSVWSTGGERREAISKIEGKTSRVVEQGLERRQHDYLWVKP
jgi:hypothetical protein